MRIAAENADLPRQDQLLPQISAFYVAKQKMQHELDANIQKLNNFIGPEKIYHHKQEEKGRHKKLLKLIDEKIYTLMMNEWKQQFTISCNIVHVFWMTINRK